MKDWLKFYFLGFFSDELSKEAAVRAFWNTLLSFLLAFILLCCALTAGYVASFGALFANSEDFHTFLYSVFAEEHGSRINLSISGGKLSASFGDGRDSVNSFDGDTDYDVGGYRLVVDTRPAATTFDNFTVECKDENGDAMSFEQYRVLSDERKAECSAVLTYSGKTLDVSEGQSEYTAFLEDSVSDSGSSDYNSDIAAEYAALKAGYAAGEVSQSEYENTVYTLYFRSYYSVFAGRDSYGDAPTLRTYYMNSNVYSGESRYLILLDDACICSFVNDGGITVDFAGYFSGMDDGAISTEGMDVSRMRANIDEMISSAFYTGGGLSFLVYIISLFRMLPVFVIAMILVTALAYLVCRIKRLEFGIKFLGMFKIVGSFLFFGAVITFICTLAYSFLFPRGAVYILSGVTLLVVLLIRTAILVIRALVAKNREGEADA